MAEEKEEVTEIKPEPVRKNTKLILIGIVIVIIILILLWYLSTPM